MTSDVITCQQFMNQLPMGAMLLGPDGKIDQINPAAGGLLGVDADQAGGKLFSEVFSKGLADRDNLLMAIDKARSKGAAVKDDTIRYQRPDGEECHLLLNTIPFADGVMGVTLSDVTQQENIRQQEEKRRSEATGLALSLRQEKDRLEAQLRGASWLRIGAALLVVMLFVGAGYFAWTRTPLVKYVVKQLGYSQPANQQAQNSYVVRPRNLTSFISFSGTVAPYETINVLSPFGGRILERHFEYGQKVEKDKLLLRLDTNELEQKLRDAEVGLIKAQDEFNRLKKWKESSTVLQARRSVEKAENDLEITEQKLQNSEMLYKKGIIPLDEYRSLKEQVENQKINMRTLKDQLKAAFKKGDARKLLVARLQLENAKAKLEQLKGQIKDSRIQAPVMGVVIKPTTGTDSKQAKPVQVGTMTAKGQVLFALGNLERLSVITQVGELNVSKLAPGQKVTLSSYSFPGLSMEGEIQAVSSQANPDSGSGSPPTFTVRVVTKKLTPKQQGKLRLGMSAELRVELFSHPRALAVPITAVHPRRGGGFAVTVLDSAGEKKQVPVTTGLTTADSVEIRTGLKAGDRVLLPSSHGGS